MTTTNGSAAELIEQLLTLPANERQRAMNAVLDKYLDKVAAALPLQLRDQAERFIGRAKITFARTAADPQKDIYACTPESIVRTVVEAAELGLAIDGKLAYAAPWNRNVGTKQKPKWIRECKLDIDYKGLIVVARRSGQIKDAWGRDVRDNDIFEHWFTDGICHLHHTWNAREPRGDTYAAFAIVEFDDKTWRYEIMDLDELKAIRNRSKAKDFGPWQTDTRQMYCKTVLRRILKLYCDDPAVGMALEIDEREFSEDIRPVEAHRIGHQQQALAAPASGPTLSERLAAARSQQPETVAVRTHAEPPDEYTQPADEGEGEWQEQESEAIDA